MKVKISLSILLMAWVCATASAETSWIEKFLERYGNTRPSARAPVSTDALFQDDVVSLSSGEAVRLLLENNREVATARLAPVSSYYAYRALDRPFEPLFRVRPKISYTNTPSRNVLVGAPALKELTHDVTMELQQTFPTGGTYTIDFGINRVSTNSVFETVNPSYNGLFTMGLTQPFLRDFGRIPNTREILIARNDQRISQLEFEAEVISLITDVQRAYWDLVFAQENVKVKQQSLDLAIKTRSDNQLQVDVGTMAPIDLVQAEAEVAARREDLITAEYDSTQLQDRLKTLITDETDPGVVLARLDLTDALQQPEAGSLPPVAQAIQLALEIRPEMRQSDRDIQNQEVNVQYTRNQKKPILDLFLEYAQTGLGGTQTIRSELGTGPVIQVIRGGPRRVFTQLFGFDFPGYTAGFNIEIPLSNGAAEADFERAVNERDIAVRRKSAAAQKIALEVRDAYTQAKKQRARVETARATLELAVQKLEAEEKKFALGASIIRFVLDEQRNLAQARTDEIQALVDYTKALIEIDRATGATLRKNNVEIRQQLPGELATVN